MSYIFRLHNEGNNNLTDWGVSAKIGSSVIDQIQDPNGESAKREITSIPSPFARIDLVKTAFKKVAEASIDGDSIHHKMVSDALDVGQIFFEFDKYRTQFDIVVWDKENHLRELSNSPHLKHRQLGDTYQTYIQQDGDVYNFNKMQRMYFLNYKSGPSEMNIIGATSPATLFYTSANDLSYVSDAIRFGRDKPFDEIFCPLYKRDIEYQKYWYALRKSVFNFAQFFPEVEKYLVKSLEQLSQSKRNEINVNGITNNDYQKNYIPIGVGDPVSILADIELKQKEQNSESIAAKSGFVIKSQNPLNGFLPLILPVDTYTHNTFYTKDTWDKNIKVPYYDNRDIKDRILPDDGAQYPYLTISDFLADTIVRMPYEIDKDNFFDGNINRPEGNSYLLPLTSTFFHFFSTKDLTERRMSDNKKMFELQSNAAGVTAILRVPIQNNRYIEYRRTYFEGLDANETGNTNRGAILEKKFGLGIMPLIRFPEDVRKHYRIAMFDKGQNDVALTCFDKNNSIETKQVIRKQKDLNLNICGSESYIVEKNFDHIQVKAGHIEAYIVPNFKVKNGNAQYTFAIDFGTTNTHIEYCTDLNPNPVAFNMSKDERQLHKMHILYTDPDIRKSFEHDFIPDTIGDNDVYSFPMRTVFSQHKNVNYDQIPMPFADGNIPFLYEKTKYLAYNEIKTDLKWGGGHDRLLEMYLETIFILMRNKVALNEGNLSSTKIVWFYPASMTEAKVNQFKKNWKNAYIKYFGENTDNVISISESTAPYNYYSKKQGARSNVVTVDVGGGTTDVFVVENRIPKMLLSFRFASNAIFGDGYNWDSDNNGFVNLYQNDFDNILINNNLQELQDALKQIATQKKSPDIIAFLFSLIGDKVNNNPSLNFLQKLSGNDKMRYVFIIFYASILYIIAKSMKAKLLEKPLTLAFSGNGSHTLRIVSDDKNMIARFAQLIFDGVYTDGKEGKIQVIMEENPKKATCKGGILNTVPQDYETIDNIKTILIGNDFEAFPEKKLSYADITPEVEQGVLQAVKDFFHFLFDLHKNNNDFLSNKLAADPAIFDKVKKICLDEIVLQQSLSDSLFHKRQEVTDDTKIEETLFFYPLIGVLHDLALEISEI
ncbi:MAG: hypothetical protein LBG80_05645 [Bacteroidales bacterium]|jgi:hypothetical protein|nr:hypothetical protein [Bacteroidales bacterium]